MKSELLKISEFLKVSGLTERSLLRMLECGALKITVDENNSLRIDVSSLTPEILAQAEPAPSVDDSACTLEEEAVASEILSALDEIIDESLALAIKWSMEKAS